MFEVSSVRVSALPKNRRLGAVPPPLPIRQLCMFSTGLNKRGTIKEQPRSYSQDRPNTAHLRSLVHLELKNFSLNSDKTDNRS